MLETRQTTDKQMKGLMSYLAMAGLTVTAVAIALVALLGAG
jgi:hypothetical protein